MRTSMINTYKDIMLELGIYTQFLDILEESNDNEE